MLVAALLLGAYACGGGAEAPSSLLDGSPARPAPFELEDLRAPTILTSVRVVDVADVEPGSRLAACLGGRWANRPEGVLVERVGVTGGSATVRSRSGIGLIGCDRSRTTSPPRSPWCGVAFGKLVRGRLRDPRLQLGSCETSDGEPVAFAWVQPGAGTRFVVVRQGGYAEVYRVADGVPVRVSTTTGIDLERSSTTLELSEHATDGRRLREYRVEARVSG